MSMVEYTSLKELACETESIHSIGGYKFISYAENIRRDLVRGITFAMSLREGRRVGPSAADRLGELHH
eukprot:1177086-Prorocentrum_minimum.AAC.1